MAKIIETSVYGFVSVRNCMVPTDDDTSLTDATEIKVGTEVITIPECLDLDDLDEDKIVELIEENDI